MRLTFLGAAGEVTGSYYLVDTGQVKFLVDCGMFQGGRAAEAKNRRFLGGARRAAGRALALRRDQREAWMARRGPGARPGRRAPPMKRNCESQMNGVDLRQIKRECRGAPKLAP